MLFLAKNINAQDDCIILPDTIYNCGFSLEITPTEFQFPVVFGYNCVHGPGDIATNEVFPGTYNITFSECGYYTITVIAEECEEFKEVVFKIDDPSFTNTEIVGENLLGYFNYECHSDGEACTNIVTIDGELPPNPEIEICHELICEYQHFFTTSIPADPSDCIADEILVESISGGNSTSGCILVDFSNITADTYCEFVDGIYGEAAASSSCPLPPVGCFDIPAECLDSITYDTIDHLFPVHEGGRWTMIEGLDTIILMDTTFVNKYMKDLLFIIDPGADYYGPGDLTFTLLELLANGDTIPGAFDAQFTLLWEELWSYDTLTEIIPQFHYSDEAECVSCGGSSFSSSKNIPEIPEFLCPPITITFGDPCSCEEADIQITGLSQISCFDPCAVLTAIFSSASGMSIQSDEWTGPSGSLGGGANLQVCEGGLYTYSVVTDPNGCVFSEDFFVEEFFDTPFATDNGPYEITCENECVVIEIVLDNQFDEGTTGICYYPDSTSGTFQGQPQPYTLCVPGTVTVELLNIFSGCPYEFSFEVEDNVEPIEFTITSPTTITCNEDCVVLETILIDVPSGAVFTWVGPNGFISNEQNPVVCSAGAYDLTVTFGNCIETLGVVVEEFFQPVVINEFMNVCEGDCVIFGGQTLCNPGSYEFLGECDTTWMLDLVVETPSFENKYEFICEGDQVEVDGQYYDTEGFYNYEIPGNNLCPVFVTLEIEVFEMDLQVMGTQSIDCVNSTSLLSVSTSNPEQNFFWYNDQNQLVGTGDTYIATEGGLYTVQNVSSNNLCIAEVTINVDSNVEEPDLTVQTEATINCENEIQLSIDVDPAANLIFTWSGPNIPADQINQQNPMITTPGTYEVTIENEFGCTTTGLIQVIGVDPMDVVASTDESCQNVDSGVIKIDVMDGGIGPFEYSIDNADFQESPIFTDVAPGNYTVYVKQADDCIWESDIVVEAIDLIEPMVSFESVYELCETPVLEFDLTQELEDHSSWNILWNDGSSQAVRSFTSAGDYSLEISNQCENREFFFRVDDSRLQDELPIYIANMFTPNADGINDELKIHTPEPPNTFSIDIYDRWGNCVFQSEDIDFSWNGNVHKVTGKSDVYAYIAKYSYLECSNKTRDFTLIGDVTVIR